MNKAAFDSIEIKNKSYRRYLNQAKSEICKAKREYKKQLAKTSKNNPKAF